MVSEQELNVAKCKLLSKVNFKPMHSALPPSSICNLWGDLRGLLLVL